MQVGRLQFSHEFAWCLENNIGPIKTWLTTRINLVLPKRSHHNVPKWGITRNLLINA
jgi:hypothetical protein